jgi:dihydrolipoamide dehydrogenase
VFVAEKIAGTHAEPVRYDAIPACTYCHPEIASVGLTEEKAKAQNIPIKVGRFPFRPLGRAMAAGETTGFVKVIYNADNGALVGAHMIGPAVTDLIAELTLAKTTEVNAESLVYTIHAHPTFAEAIKGASEEAFGHAIDL